MAVAHGGQSPSPPGTAIPVLEQADTIYGVLDRGPQYYRPVEPPSARTAQLADAFAAFVSRAAAGSARASGSGDDDASTYFSLTPGQMASMREVPDASPDVKGAFRGDTHICGSTRKRLSLYYISKHQ